jgi:hypothetical protein
VPLSVTLLTRHLQYSVSQNLLAIMCGHDWLLLIKHMAHYFGVIAHETPINVAVVM